MNLRTGNLFLSPGVPVVTTNAILNRHGHLVMGRGAALEASRRFPGLALNAGTALGSLDLVGGRYGLLTPAQLEQPILLFQVKLHWKDAADIHLIRHSTEKLAVYAADRRWQTFNLNFPGIGNGRLAHRFEEILSVLSDLPDNVSVWTL